MLDEIAGCLNHSISLMIVISITSGLPEQRAFAAVIAEPFTYVIVRLVNDESPNKQPTNKCALQLISYGK